MTSVEHPQHEDVMAFLDGELTAASEADIRAHLDRCHACRSLAGDLRAVSDQLTAWRVEPVPAMLDVRVKDAIRAAMSKESEVLEAIGSSERERGGCVIVSRERGLLGVGRGHFG